MNNLYVISTQSNHEKDVFDTMVYRKIQIANNAIPTVKTVFFVEQFKGYVYIEAERAFDAVRIGQNVTGVKDASVRSTPMTQIVDVFGKATKIEMKEGLSEDNLIRVISTKNLTESVKNSFDKKENVIRFHFYDFLDEKIGSLAIFTPDSTVLTEMNLRFEKPLVDKSNSDKTVQGSNLKDTMSMKQNPRISKPKKPKEIIKTNPQSEMIISKKTDIGHNSPDIDEDSKKLLRQIKKTTISQNIEHAKPSYLPIKSEDHNTNDVFEKRTFEKKSEIVKEEEVSEELEEINEELEEKSETNFEEDNEIDTDEEEDSHHTLSEAQELKLLKEKYENTLQNLNETQKKYQNLYTKYSVLITNHQDLINKTEKTETELKTLKSALKILKDYI
jgi:hypothetical protein